MGETPLPKQPDDDPVMLARQLQTLLDLSVDRKQKESFWDQLPNEQRASLFFGMTWSIGKVISKIPTDDEDMQRLRNLERLFAGLDNDSQQTARHMADKALDASFDHKAAKARKNYGAAVSRTEYAQEAQLVLQRLLAALEKGHGKTP